jgi:lactoylglutathione lyase
MSDQMLHVCFRVKDLEASEKFYQEAFGFRISRKRDFPDHGFTLSYLAAPKFPFELELTFNHGRTEPYEIGDGYSHLAVGVRDLEESHRRHQEGGFNPEPIKGFDQKGKGHFYFLADPDGYFVEVVRL